MTTKSKLPIVYSCSGCSSAAQMANYIALALDRSGVAQMSCIAGVGGNVDILVKVATTAQSIITLDGCALKCTHHCLARHNLIPNKAIILSEYGVKKKYKADFDMDHAQQVLAEIKKEVSQLLPKSTTDED